VLTHGVIHIAPLRGLSVIVHIITIFCGLRKYFVDYKHKLFIDKTPPRRYFLFAANFHHFILFGNKIET
jgi:hypothetical protein